MKILDFVTKKEEAHKMNTLAVDKDFDCVPFFNKMMEEIPENARYNHGFTHFDWSAEENVLEEAWNNVYKKNRKYFKK